MENRKGLAILLVLSLVYFPHCMGSGAAVKPIESVNSTENFLFTYFNLKELGPLLKTVSKDVQYLISGYLRDRYLVPFVVHTPLAEYTGNEAFDSSLSDSLYISPDDSCIALITENNVLMKDLELNGAPHKGSLADFRSHADLRLISPCARHLVFNEEFTLITATCVNSEVKAQIIEWMVDSNKAVGKEEFVGLQSELFHDETICRSVVGDQQGFTKNIVVNLCYAQDGALVVATTYAKVYVRSLDGSVKKIEDKRYASINEPYYGTALINTPTSTVVFQSCDAVVVCNYETGTYRTLQESPDNAHFVKCISSDGEFLLLTSRSCNKTAYVMQLKTGHVRTIILPGSAYVGESAFSHDGKWLLISNYAETLLYDTQTLSHIGYLDHMPDVKEHERHCHILGGRSIDVTFSKTGFCFGTYTKVPHSGIKPKPVVAIWRTNPHWAALQALYQGHITLEQALFLVFLYKNARERISLATIAQEAGFSREDLITYLKKVRDSFGVDQKALREYIRTTISRLPS